MGLFYNWYTGNADVISVVLSNTSLTRVRTSDKKRKVLIASVKQTKEKQIHARIALQTIVPNGLGWIDDG